MGFKAGWNGPFDWDSLVAWVEWAYSLPEDPDERAAAISKGCPETPEDLT